MRLTPFLLLLLYRRFRSRPPMNASAERADTITINRRMSHFDGHS